MVRPGNVPAPGTPDPGRGDRADRCILPPMPPRLQPGLIACLLLLSGAVTACAPPVPTGDFDSPDPSSRIYAAVRVASQHDRDGARPDRATLQHLIEMLLSSDPAERLIAGDTLKLVTGEDFGFDPSAPLAERASAVERWKTWLDDEPAVGASGAAG